MASLSKYQMIPKDPFQKRPNQLKESYDKPSRKFADGDGTLELTIIRGMLYKDTELFGKMDPYVAVVYNNFIYKTQVA